jgi:D-alanine-D-alanine ligase
MNIAILAGGRSPEHDISLSSARMVLRQLRRDRYRVWPVHLDRDGAWWLPKEPWSAEEDWSVDSGAIRLSPGAAIDHLIAECAVECVFPVLHGPFGEDGTVQGMLELHGIAFVGSGCAASAVAMDKLRTRSALEAVGVPMAEIHRPTASLARLGLAADLDASLALYRQIAEKLGLPFYCKVDTSGSSRGVVRVAEFGDWSSFVAAHQDCRQRWFAERGVVGEEITVAVLGNREGELQALPAVGIYPRFGEHFDERAKYEPGACDEVVPPRGLDAAQLAQAEDLALRSHVELGCDGMSRTDMIFTAQGPVVLEVNTIPGLTPTSLLPKAAAAAGMDFPALLDRLVDLALESKARACPSLGRA